MGWSPWSWWSCTGGSSPLSRSSSVFSSNSSCKGTSMRWVTDVLRIFSCHTLAFWSRLNRNGDWGESWPMLLIKSKVFCSSAVSSRQHQCIINQTVLRAFSLSSSSPAFNAQLFFPPILQIRSQLYWTTSTSCSFHMTMINQIVNLNFRNNLCKLDQNENQVTHLSEVSPPQILNCKQTHTVVHFVIYCYSLYFSPPFL